MKKIFFLFCLLPQILIATPNIDKWTTLEGAKVLFAQTKGLPMLDIQLNFDAASSKDGAKFGLASLTNGLLGSATKNKDEEQIINAFKLLGVKFSQKSLKDTAIVSMRSLSEKPVLAKAVTLFSEIVSQPEFKEKYLIRNKKLAIRVIKTKKQTPSDVAFNTFEKAVFGNHPYAHFEIGNESTVNDISLEDIKKHYKDYYVAKNLTISLVGDVTKDKAKQIAKQISSKLNTGIKANSTVKVMPLYKAQNIHIDFDSKQTHLIIGQVGISRSHPHYYALILGNNILGGNGLTSILSTEIREKRGLAYFVGSSFVKMQANGTFLLALQTKNTQTAKAKSIVIKTFQDFLNNAVSMQQLEDAKNNMIGNFALNTASNADILVYLSIIGFYDLPLNYLETFAAKINKVTAKEIKQAFNSLIDPSKLVVLTVGQKK